MGWFSKKEKIPELPPAPTLPELPDSSKSKNELPALPPTELGKNLNQEMVKSAVGNSDTEKSSLPIPPQPTVNKDQPQMIPSIASIPNSAEEVKPEEHKQTKDLTPIKIEQTPQEQPITRPADSIFVKIEDFQEAQKDFKEITKKIKQIEKTLVKVRDKKIKEDEEIADWTDEIEKTKTKLSEIDSDIFSKL